MKQNKVSTKPNKNAAVVITKDANLGKTVMQYPEIVEVLLDYGLHCVGCIANTFDSIEAGAKVHGLTDEDIEEMLERVNEVINYKE
jgi:hybrid cluster-associated redox disulfide protein